jgi:hypothetical protein
VVAPTRPLCAWLTRSEADTLPVVAEAVEGRVVVPMRPSVDVDVDEDVRAAVVAPTRPVLPAGRDEAVASTRLDAEDTPAVGRVVAPVPTRLELTVGRELTPAV